MKTKKTTKANLEKKRFLFLELGLLLALGICFAAFEWSSEESNSTDLGNLKASSYFEEDVQITVTPPPPPEIRPPDPVVIPEVILIVDKPVDNDNKIFIEKTDPVSPVIRKPVIPDDVPDEIPEAIDYVKVEVKPVFPGGDAALLSFIRDNTKYPEIPKENNVEGKVYVKFIIDTKGKVTGVSIAKGVDPYLDAEAMRVVSLIPEWSPGKQRNKAVPVSYIIPINFKLY